MSPIDQQPPQEEENPDYDMFESVRPKGISVDDNLKDELDGEQVDDFDSVRPKDIEPKKQKKPSKTDIVIENAKDFAKQGIKETLIGLGGTYGDLAELAGLRKGSGSGSEARNNKEYEASQRINQPGYQPSAEDLESLTSDDNTSPSSFNAFNILPTSEGLRGIAEKLGAPGEAETPSGKYGARMGKLYGSGLAFGQVNPIPAIAGGAAGQATEDLGGGPLSQAAAEIVTMIASQGRSGTSTVSSSKKAVQNKIDELRKLGYTEEDITLAINSAYKDGKAVKIASKSDKTKDAFKNFSEHSDEIVSDILSAEIPGIERGVKHVHELASEAYGKVVDSGRNIIIKDSKPFLDSVKTVESELARNLGKNPEAAPFLKRLKDAANAAKKNPSADSYINFYQELNSLGKWMGRSQKDRLLTKVKDGIKDTFRAEGKQGKQLADDFEKVNQGIKKAYGAEEVHNLIQKVTSSEGIDYKKLNKLFDKKENVELFEQVLGKSQTRNLNLISKTGKEIKDFDKAWKSVNGIKGATESALGKGAAGYFLFQGDFDSLIRFGASAAGKLGISKLAEKSLTDPNFQNLLIRGLHAIKNNSPKTLKSVNEAIKKYADEQGIEIDFDLDNI